MLKDEAVTIDQVRQIVREEVERAFKKDPAARRACIIASKGTLDWAYPPLILSTAAAAAGMSAAIFFTFYGLNIIRKDFEQILKVSPVGNPAMPMPVPMPDIVTALPGMTGMATGMMPVTGLPLPLFSYGGSFILVCYMMIGLIVSVGARRDS